MKLELILKPCPWCKKTPELEMPIPDDTWCWNIQCRNPSCAVNPKSKHVSIRNTNKTQFFSFHGKVEKLVLGWNYGNLCKPYEKKVIDLAMLPELNASAEVLCARNPWFKTIYEGNDKI